MTEKQYSDIQRNLGVIEGVAAAIQGNEAASNLLYDALQSLETIINEIRRAEDEQP
jgi:hypothetical protein